MSEISDLFARDPLSLTQEDLRKTIEHYRSNREKYLSGVKQEKTKPTKLASLDLSALGL